MKVADSKLLTKIISNITEFLSKMEKIPEIKTKHLNKSPDIGGSINRNDEGYEVSIYLKDITYEFVGSKEHILKRLQDVFIIGDDVE